MSSTPTVTPHYEGGEGEPLVLLHGINLSWTVWRPVLPLLEARHAVFAPTIAGHRGAAPLQDGIEVSADTLVDALERGLDEAGIETAHLAGNSLGGWLALELARRGRARSVVALSPAGAFASDRDAARVVRMLTQARRLGIPLADKLGPLISRPRGRRLLLRVAFEHPERVPPAVVAQQLEDMAACVMFDDFVKFVRGGGRFQAGLDVSRQPVRIAWAEKDRTIPFKAYGQPMLDLLPGAEHVSMPGVGHVPMYDDPELVARTILEVTSRPTSTNGATSSAPQTKETAPMSPTATSTDFELDGAEGRIIGRQWSPDSPRFAVLLAHGYGEHTGRYEHVAAHLVGEGAAVYAPDHLGHGRSAGDRALVADMDVVVGDLHLVADRIRSEHPGLALVLIGHSLGGLLATRFAQLHGDELTALVLSGPAVGDNPAFQLLAMDPIPEIPIDPAILSRDAAVGDAYAADALVYHGPFLRPTLEAMSAAAGRVDEGPEFGDLPTLYLHGEGDQLVPVDVAAPVVRKVGGSRLQEKVYPGAQHEIFNETNKDEVLGDVSAFLRGVLQ